MPRELVAALSAIGAMAKAHLQLGGLAWDDALSRAAILEHLVASGHAAVGHLVALSTALGLVAEAEWERHVAEDCAKIAARTGTALPPRPTKPPGEGWTASVARDARWLASCYACQGTRPWGAAEALIDLHYQAACLVAALGCPDAAGAEISDMLGHVCFVTDVARDGG